MEGQVSYTYAYNDKARHMTSKTEREGESSYGLPPARQQKKEIENA